VSYDPVTRTAINFLKEVGGIYEFGVRFPFNNDSTTDLDVTGTTSLTVQLNYYRDITIGASGVLTCDSGLSPLFIFARNITIAAGGQIDVSDRGPIWVSVPADNGGAAVTGSSSGNPGTVGNTGLASDKGAATVTVPPQYHEGWATGGSGGGGGGGGGGVGDTGGLGGVGGPGGRACGQPSVSGSATTTPPAGGTAGAAGAAGSTGGAGGQGNAGANMQELKMLGNLLLY